MSYKMIVMDMDDTLLRDDHTISNENKKAIKEAQERGVKVVLASGRPTYAMKSTAKELELDKYGSYLISFNGAVITDCKTDETVFEQSLRKEIAHKLYDLSLEHNVYIHTYVSDEIITAKSNKYTDIENSITGMPVKTMENFKEAVKGNVIKVLMLENPEYLKKVEKTLKSKLSDTLNVTISKPFFLEFMDKGINKASGIERLINKLNIKKEEVIAIGDSYNDLEMIQYAGLGVCVDNAPEDIKKYASHITVSNMEHGVAKTIQEFILL